MKLLLPALFVAATATFTGCNSLDNPVGGLFGSGRDARVYNAQTGEFEWPKDGAKARRRNAAAASPAAAAEPARTSDGRYFDAQRNQWVEARQERASTPAPVKPRSPVLIATSIPMAEAAPAPPTSRTASGVYNPSTGRIEWTPNSVARDVPRQKSAKRWWWPF